MTDEPIGRQEFNSGMREIRGLSCVYYRTTE